MSDLIREVERLELRDGEVLIVRPRNVLSPGDRELLHRNLSKLADRMGWDRERIIVLDRDVQMSVVAAEQMSLSGP